MSLTIGLIRIVLRELLQIFGEFMELCSSTFTKYYGYLWGSWIVSIKVILTLFTLHHIFS